MHGFWQSVRSFWFSYIASPVSIKLFFVWKFGWSCEYRFNLDSKADEIGLLQLEQMFLGVVVAASCLQWRTDRASHNSPICCEASLRKQGTELVDSCRHGHSDGTCMEADPEFLCPNVLPAVCMLLQQQIIREVVKFKGPLWARYATSFLQEEREPEDLLTQWS